MNFYVDGLHVCIIGCVLMLVGFTLFMSNIGIEGMHDQLKDSAWQNYLSYRDYAWLASGILGLGGLGLFAVSFKMESYGGP